eukprot:TRINITY_DN4775_c0_g1_i1.p1 TRINITY_DN4775_c0_g1~~TRINITY_DN4775_c0_g1_i1.p1  ORF type:complete len:292 (-),score=40.25 TRINITY_DN4775_c0_g1_i1:410-1285(-)
MKSLYSKGKICPYVEPASTCSASLTLEPGIRKIISKSRNYDELLYTWTAWRNATGPKIRPYYLEYLQFQNQVAILNGFDDASEMWMEPYESKTFGEDITRLYEELKPLYEELHAYVRGKLRQLYGVDKVSANGPLPAHLLGNMWAQSWNNIFDIVKPYPDSVALDVTPEMVAQEYNSKRMFEESEKFFTSLGLDPMTKTFWKKSIIERPSDGRELVCHASAWDFYNGDDFRIKQCTEVTMNDFRTVHTKWVTLHMINCTKINQLCSVMELTQDSMRQSVIPSPCLLLRQSI